MDKNVKKRIALTGGTGVLGKLFQQRYSDTYIIDCFEGDIRNIHQVRRWLSAMDRIDAVIHLAALVPVNTVTERPFDAYHVNVGGTLTLLSCIETLSIKPWVFYCSTSHVYKSNLHSAIKETDATEPISTYGQTKLAAERAVSAYQNQENKKVCIGRVFSFYHDSQKPPFLFPAIKERVKQHKANENFELFGALNIRDFLNAEDVVDIIIDLFEKKAEGIFNIASGIPMTIKDFVLQHIKSNLEITYEHKPISSLYADISKLKSIQYRE